MVSHARSLELEELENGWKISADIMTDRITPETSLMDIKGPTYSEMLVEYDMDKSAWVVQAVIDI